jgi:hypothetical protein
VKLLCTNSDNDDHTDGSLTAANGPLPASGETAISLGRGLEVQFIWGLAARLEGSYVPETDMKMNARFR